MSLNSIKLVTFDVTNTLLKFRLPSWQYYTLVAKDHGYTVNEEILRAKYKETYQMMWNQYPNFGKTKMTWVEWWMQVVKKTFEGQLPNTADTDIIAGKLISDFGTAKCWYVAPGGHKLLSLLKSMDKTIGVISNFDPSLIDVLRSVEIDNYFDFVVSSYQVGFSKPGKRIFDYALAQCKSTVQPCEALHIGDDLINDFEGPRAAKWHALLVTQKALPEKPPALNHMFKTLEEIIDAIEQKQLSL